MQKFMRAFSNREFIVIVILIFLMVTSPIVLFLQAAEGDRETLENQGYLRYVACVIDVRNRTSSITISPEKLDKCWEIADAQAGVKLPRYYELIK